MATVPYSPVPGVEANQAPLGREEIQASPADFGAMQGQATEKLGGDIGQTAQALDQNALRMQDLNNSTAARDAANGYIASAGQAWAQYDTLQGKAKADAYPAFIKQLGDLQKQHAATLASPMARSDFLNNSSYILNRLSLMGSTSAAQAQQQYWKQSHAANIDSMMNTGVLFQNDPKTIDAAANSISASVDALGNMNNLDPVTVQTQKAARG